MLDHGAACIAPFERVDGMLTLMKLESMLVLCLSWFGTDPSALLQVSNAGQCVSTGEVC